MASAFSKIIEWICLVALCLVALAGLIVLAMRQVSFANPVIWNDVQAYAFAVLILFSIAVASINGRHVAMRAAKADGLSLSKGRTLVELLLVCVSFSVILLYAIEPVHLAWVNFEGSTQPNGLPGYFLVRSFLPTVCVLMIAVAVRKFLKSGQQNQ